MKISHAHKFLAILLSVVLLISCVPMFVSADGFVEENLLQTKLDSASPVLYYANSLSTADGSARVSAAWLSAMTDGDRNTSTDIYAYSAGDYRWFGGQFALTEESFVGRIDVYGDYENLPVYYNVYASDSLDSLYRNVNKTLIRCDGTVQSVVVNKNVRYIAVVMQNAMNADTTSRLKEIEVYSGDPTTAFQAVDLTNDAQKLVEAKPIKVSGGVAADDTNTTNINTYLPYALTNLTSAHKDWKMTSGYDMGVQFTFDASYYIGRIDIDAAIYNASNTYDETWTVYASNDLSLLYDSSSIVADDLVCTKAMGIQLQANVFAKYVALVNNYNGNMRVRAFRIYTADDTGVERPFEPENVLRTAVDSSTGILMNASTEAVSVNNRFSDASIALVTDGNNATTNDVYGALDWGTPYYVGAKFTLEEETIISTVKVYSGSDTYNETWRVYASDSEEDLYAPQNLAGEEVCDGTAVEFTINKSVSYIAFICTDYDGNMRVAEFEAWSAEEIVGFVTENALETQLSSSRSIKLFPETGTVEDSPIFNTNGVLASAVDGNTTIHHDISAPYSDPTQYFGGEYTLNDYYYIGNAVIYSGFDAYPDTVRIYASSDIETLYTSANMITSGLVCSDLPQTVAINKYVKYFAVVYESYGRAKEFQLWTADPEGVEPPTPPFEAENVLLTEAGHVTSSRCIQFYPTNHYVDDASRIDSEKVAGLTDGVTNSTYDCYSALDWDPARYIGVEYTLDDSYFIGELKIYSGYTTSVDTFDVYASDSFESLYNDANCVATGLECNGTVQTINVGKEIQYVAFLISGVELYCARIAEFEAWTADPNASGPVSPSTLSVLTIGNSYSENTSIYASEIALANGKNLTFGYLKSPSCSIEKHYNAAVNDIAGFKFQITAPDGNGGVTRTTIKDGSGTTVDNPNSEHGATIDEALDYMDWDVIVFQQESSSSRSYETFAYLDELVDYVHTACPDAKLMFHEVWRWGEWEASEFFGAGKIKQNAEKAARENGLELIASGLAFEYARELMDSATYPNEDDGHWQHANTVGQYLAGVCYVNKLFNIYCSESAFASHPYINADSNVAQLTACANRASRYYNSYGDLDFDGEINAEDLATLVDVLLEKDGTEYDATLADVNNDGSINVVDIVALKKKLATLDEAE